MPDDNLDGDGRSITNRFLLDRIDRLDKELQEQLRSLVDRWTANLGRVNLTLAKVEGKLERVEELDGGLQKLRDGVLTLEPTETARLRAVLDRERSHGETIDAMVRWYAGHGLLLDRILTASITLLVAVAGALVVWYLTHGHP